MRILSLIFTSLTFAVFGQGNTKIYTIQLGNFKCKPEFQAQQIDTSGPIVPASLVWLEPDKKPLKTSKADAWRAVERTLIPNGNLTELPIYFPKRADTIMYEFPGKKPVQKIQYVDHYTFLNVHDSIPAASLDSLLNGELKCLDNRVTHKIVHYDLQFLYADGKQFIKEMKKTSPLSDVEIRKNAKAGKIIYVGIFNIDIKTSRNKIVSISEGFGWKIIHNN